MQKNMTTYKQAHSLEIQIIFPQHTIILSCYTLCYMLCSNPMFHCRLDSEGSENILNSIHINKSHGPLYPG